MNQGFAVFDGFRAPRRAVALLLAVILNVAMIPCSMAVEVVQEGHDCCPPQLDLRALECCELDDVSLDVREGLFEQAGDVDAAPAPFVADNVLPPPPRFSAAMDPPDPPGIPTDLIKLHCTYLK